MPGVQTGKTEAMEKSVRAAKNMHGNQEKLDGLVKWLVDHGVSKGNARRFLIRTGCDSLHSIAVWLRFQLPPLHLANVDCVYVEMRNQLGIAGKKADAIIEELNVADCVNVDVNQEATMHLVETGTLHNAPSFMDSVNGASNRMDAEVVPEPRSYAGRRSGRSLGRQHSHPSHPGSIDPPKSWGYTPSPPGSYSNYAPSNPSMRRLSPSPSPTAGRGASPSRYSDPQHLRPQDPQYAVFNSMLEGKNATALQQPQRSGQPWIMVSHSSNQGSVPASPRGSFNNGLPEGHVSPRVAGEYNSPQQQQQPNRSRGQGRGVGEGLEDICTQDMQAVGIGAQAVCEGNIRTYENRMYDASSADLVMSVGMPPQQPIGEGVNKPSASFQMQGEQWPVAEGASPHNLSPRGLAYIEDHMSSVTGNSGLDLAPPPPQLPAFMWGTGGHVGGNSDAIASEKLPGVPTVSKPLDPGAYHQANVMLRKQMPHYIAKVTVNFHWDHVAVWILTIVAVVAYISVRIWYLASGKSSSLGQDGVNIPYSWMTLIAEGALSALGIYLHQNFWKQDVQFTEMSPRAMDKMFQAVKQKGMSQTVHVLIATYTEPAVTVRECVLRLLVAPEPVYMEKMIYVCDDGHAKSEGPKKKAMVEELRILGHTNVFYVGDRVKKPDQLNGKSANLNHVLLKKIYPTVKRADQVPLKDIFMVMDCDHMVKPDIFNKMGPCMLSDRTAVCLVPQCFHNTIHPDALDAANGDFMFGKLPFYFGAGVLFVTGTNVMVRCRSAFEVCKYADANAEASEDGEDHRQLFTVDEISEDVVLGSRLHAAGFKGVFVAENLATGEVPLEARAMWRQRFRWFKGGHLFLLSPTSVFFEKHRHMTFYQKTLYWICLVANVLSIYADPVLMAMPFLCLVLDICVYGLDALLFWTHFANTIILQVGGAYYTEWQRVKDALKAHVAFKVLWFTTVKACINTVMVMSGWKKSGVFKATPKLGEKAEDQVNSSTLPDAGGSDVGRGSDSNKSTKKGFELHQIHDALSKVTEVRKKFMPYDGTLDFWVLMGITFLTLFAMAIGVRDLIRDNAIYNFTLDNQSLKWLAIVWALHHTMPGIIFGGYLLTWNSCPAFLKFYVPAVTFAVFASLFFLEFRIAYAFLFEF